MIGVAIEHLVSLADGWRALCSSFGQGYLLYARIGNPEEGTALADFKSFVENNFRNAKCEEEHAGAVRYAVLSVAWLDLSPIANTYLLSADLHWRLVV